MYKFFIVVLSIISLQSQAGLINTNTACNVSNTITQNGSAFGQLSFCFDKTTNNGSIFGTDGTGNLTTSASIFLGSSLDVTMFDALFLPVNWTQTYDPITQYINFFPSSAAFATQDYQFDFHVKSNYSFSGFLPSTMQSHTTNMYGELATNYYQLPVFSFVNTANNLVKKTNVPEPNTIFILSIGLILLGFSTRKHALLKNTTCAKKSIDT